MKTVDIVIGLSAPITLPCGRFSDVGCDIFSDAKYDGYAFFFRSPRADTELRAHAAPAAPHDPTDYPNIKVVATAGEPCPLRMSAAAHTFSAPPNLPISHSTR